MGQNSPATDPSILGQMAGSDERTSPGSHPPGILQSRAQRRSKASLRRCLRQSGQTIKPTPHADRTFLETYASGPRRMRSDPPSSGASQDRRKPCALFSTTVASNTPGPCGRKLRKKEPGGRFIRRLGIASVGFHDDAVPGFIHNVGPRNRTFSRSRKGCRPNTCSRCQRIDSVVGGVVHRIRVHGLNTFQLSQRRCCKQNTGGADDSATFVCG